MLFAKLNLIGFAHFFELLYCICGSKLKLFKLDIFLDDLLHFGFDLFEILGRERLFDIEIVIESVVDSRSDSELYFGEESFYSLSHDMGSGVAECLFTVLIGECQHLEGSVLVKLCAEVADLAVQFYGTGGLIESHADSLYGISGGNAVFVLTD